MNHDRYSDDLIASILRDNTSVALVGASANTSRPSYFVMKYLLGKGYRVVPVNVGLAGQELLGQQVYAALADVPAPIGIVDIFRNAEAALEITREAIAQKNRLGVRVIWMQLGVRNEQAAAEAGCNEAWMLDGEMVTEGGSSTAYILTADDTIITRPRSTMTLAGCTCAALQTLVDERGLKLEERPFSLSEAKAAKEAFATSATTLVAAVVEIDGEPVGDGKPGPVATELRRLYVERARAS